LWFELYKALVDGWIPPSSISEEEYNTLRAACGANTREVVTDSALYGFVGICCAFGAKWFDAYARNSTGRNYAELGKRDVLRTAPRLRGVTFYSLPYQDLPIPPRSIIYCDPPYMEATQYLGGASFDSTTFYDWCRARAAEGHALYISEYSCPDDFTLLWTKHVNVAIDKITDISSKKRVRTELLYTIR
jgi:DNA adenine methylase